MTLTLQAETREIKGKKNKTLRQKGLIPAVLYGPGMQNYHLAVSEHDFEIVRRQAGASSLVELNVEGAQQPFRVLINDFQRDPVTSKILHVDFYQPDLTKEIEAKVPLVFIGESTAVKDLGGTLVKNISEVTVKALPLDLPREIKVDISRLKTFDDSITIKDLPLRANVKILKHPDEIVAVAEPVQEVEKELETPIEENVEAVEQIVKEKKEDVSAEELEEVSSKPSEK